MKLIVKDMDIATGGILIAILNEHDAQKYDMHPGDRILIEAGSRKITAVLDVAEHDKVVPHGKVGLFEEVLSALKVHHGDEIRITLEEKPVSLQYIRKKLDGKELNKEEIHTIIQDIVDNKLTDIELTYFVAAGYTRGFSDKETTLLTKAMIDTGEKLDIKDGIILDKHCIGGVAGNRTTMLVIPIVAAAGFTIPKTSSRSITSPAGTADTMEVLANVSLDKKQIQQVVKKTGGCLVWGGAVNLAPADDRIIGVEHPLSIDAEGQLLASVMAKKGSVGAKHVLIDIPVGKGAKIEDKREAKHLACKFIKLGSSLGMTVDAVISDGSSPIGRGIGPALEARDVLWVLKNDARAPLDLRTKALTMAARIMTVKYSPKKAAEIAKEILDSGKAYAKMVEIIKAQGEKITDPDKIPMAEQMSDYRATKSGKIVHIHNGVISKVARIAGAPHDPGAGLYIKKLVGEKVKKGDVLFTLYADSDQRLRYAVEFLILHQAYDIR